VEDSFFLQLQLESTNKAEPLVYVSLMLLVIFSRPY